MLRHLLLVPFKLYLLIRYDVKQQLTSVWFHLILLGVASLPPAWYACYPANPNFRVLMVDDLANANFSKVVERIREEGFPVERRLDLQTALDELLGYQATMVVHVERSGQVSWYATTPRIRKVLTRTVQAALLGELNSQLDDQARRDGRPVCEIEAVAQNYFTGIPGRDVSSATFMVRCTWYFTSLIALTMFLMARSSLAKFRRMYSMPLMLMGKLVAGLICGTAVVVPFLAMAWLCGFVIPDLPRYLAAYALAIFSGVAFGCLAGAIPLALSSDMMGLVFAGLMGLSLTFMGYAQLSAFLTPISNMDPLVYTIDIANPLYNLNQLIYDTTFLGEGLLEGPNPVYIERVLALSAGALLTALFFLLLI